MPKIFDLTDQKAVLAEIKSRVIHFYGQTDGTIAFPNSCEGDLIKMAYRAAMQVLGAAGSMKALKSFVRK